MDTLTQVERLIELAIIQRSELRRLVEELPQLKAHLSEEIERTFEETEPQLRAELEEWTTKQTADKTAALGVALEAKIADLAKSLEVSTQARYNAIIAEREENARLAAQAEAKIAEHAASLPGAVKEIVSAELARFPRAGEIDQLRKEFAEPKSLNPRGKWQAGETYKKLDLVTINGDSYVSNIDGNTEKPSRSAANWTLNAARGNSGGGGGITALNDLLGNPSAGDIVGSEGNNYVRKTLTAGTGITITDDPSTITIDASGAQEMLTATVKNAESVAITRGQVVYLFSATGGFPSVKLAYNTSDATSAKTFGVVSDVSIAPNGTGTITCVGVVSNLNLGAYNDGDTVYLGATPGSFTATKPYAPNHLVYVGIIERANAGNGELYVRIQNGYELDEIHDVQINSPLLAGQTLIYDATTDLWKNARLTAGVGVSISNGDSAITISADGGVNYQGTWNASTNTPTLTSSVGTKGFYYVVSVAGSTNLNGVTDWKVGDWAIFNGTAWEKVDTTDQVSSVFGRTGAVVGVSTDYSSVGITNTAIGASNPSTGAFTTLSATGNLTVSGTGTSSVAGNLNFNGTGAATPPSGLNYGLFPQSGLGLGINSVAGGVGVWLAANGAFRLNSNTATNDYTGFEFTNATIGITGSSAYVRAIRTASSGSPTDLAFGIMASGTLAEAARFKSNGNFLVGTTTDAGYTITARATDASIAAMSSDASSQIRLNAQSGIAILETVTNTPLRFRTNSTEAMRLFANGNVFVGASPVDGGQKLQVSGNAEINGTAFGGYNLSVRDTGLVAVGAAYRVYNASNSNEWRWGMRDSGGSLSSSLSFSFGDNVNPWVTALSLSNTGNATFAGDVTVNGGNVGVGTSALANYGMDVRPTALSGAGQAGINIIGAATSSATSFNYGIRIIPGSAAAAFTSTLGAGVFVGTPNLGAGSAITTQSGLYIDNQGTAGITNAYGIDIAAQSGAATTNIGLRNAGITSLTNSTASSSTTTGALVVTGGVGVGGAINAGGNVSIKATTNLGRATLLVQTDNSDPAGVNAFSGAVSGALLDAAQGYGTVLFRPAARPSASFPADGALYLYTSKFNGSIYAHTLAATISDTNANFAGNLTVSGGSIIGGTSLTLSGGTGDIAFSTSGIIQVPNGVGIRCAQTNNTGSIYLDSANLEVRNPSAGYATALKLANNGNFFIGTTTDSGNGKLQLATHTTSAGGIGFGTDTSLHRGNAAGKLNLYGSSTTSTFQFVDSTGLTAVAGTIGGDFYLYTAAAKSIFLQTNYTTALTLDSSQNATFAGKLTVQGTAASTYSGTIDVVKAGGGKLLGLSSTNGNSPFLNVGDGVAYGINFGIDSSDSSFPGRINSTDGGLKLQTNSTTRLSIAASTGNAEFSGNIKTAAPSGGTAATWRLGTVASVSPTSPNRTIEVEIGGTTYYIHAKTTNN